MITAPKPTHSRGWVPQTLRTLLHASAPVQVASAQVEALRTAGCEIRETSPGFFSLIRTSLSVWSDYLASLNSPRFPKRIVEIYNRTGSTQNVIRRLIEAHGPAAAGAVAATDEQTAGRGRLGRKWHAPPGWSALLSMAWIAQENIASVSEWLAMSAAVAVAQGLKQVLATGDIDQSSAVKVGIKWPNDVLIDGRKVAGILVETLPQHRAAIIGVGINVTHDASLIPEEVRHRFGSLDMFGCRRDRLLVLAKVIHELDQTLATETTHERTLKTWRDMNTYGPDQIVTFEQNGQVIRGCILDLDAKEGLIVRTADGTIVHLPAATTSVVM